MIRYKLIGSTNENIIDCVLENRGLTRSQVNEILEPSIEEYDGMLFRNMKIGIDMLHKAIENNINIGIVVDTDCDGYCLKDEIDSFLEMEINI